MRKIVMVIGMVAAMMAGADPAHGPMMPSRLVLDIPMAACVSTYIENEPALALVPLADARAIAVEQCVENLGKDV